MRDTKMQLKNEVKDREYADRQEIEHALASLTDADKKKLMIAAKYWSKKFELQKSEVSPEDLLQEAIARSLETESPRRWPKTVVTFVKYLDRGMESIASHHRERLDSERETQKNSRALDPIPIRKGLSVPMPIPENDTTDTLAARDEIEALRAFFGSDEQAFRAVWCRALGMEGQEIIDELGIDEKEWEAVRKRVQRKLLEFNKETEEE